MIGVVDVGGGERGIYGAGVFDYCIENGIHMDCCVGVSAGAANLVSYMAGQVGRNFAYYTNYSFRKEYMSLGMFLRKGCYLDLEYIYGTLSNSDGEYPLDYPAMVASGKQLYVVATDSETAKPAYFTLDDIRQDDYAAIKASSALPFATKPYPVNGRTYFDGGLSDPIPVRKALALGCEKVVVVLTRPGDLKRKPHRDKLAARVLAAKYPRVAQALAARADVYNFQLDLAKRYEREGKVLIVAPDDISGLSTLTKDREALEGLYAKGLADARAIEKFLG